MSVLETTTVSDRGRPLCDGLRVPDPGPGAGAALPSCRPFSGKTQREAALRDSSTMHGAIHLIGKHDAAPFQPGRLTYDTAVCLRSLSRCLSGRWESQWLEIMQSIALHGLEDYHDYETSPKASTCSYSPGPDNSSGVVNAKSTGRSLTAASSTSRKKYLKVADRNVEFCPRISKLLTALGITR